MPSNPAAVPKAPNAQKAVNGKIISKPTGEKPKTFLESVYPNGVGPDSDLI